MTEVRDVAALTGVNEGEVSTEAEDRQVGLLEVARIMHEQGKDIAQGIYEETKETYFKPGVDRFVDKDRMRITESEGRDVRRVAVFIGSKPPENKPDAFRDYPRIHFFFRREGNTWSPWGVQVGVRGHMMGTQRIIDHYNEKGSLPSMMIDTSVQMKDLEAQLGGYKPRSSVSAPSLPVASTRNS